MKDLFLAIMIGFFCFLLGGCVNRPNGTPPAPKLLIQPVLDRIVPADFRGNGTFEERGFYLTLVISAQGLQRTDKGWTWTKLEYERVVTVPLITGLHYKQEGKIRLESPQ